MVHVHTHHVHTPLDTHTHLFAQVEMHSKRKPSEDVRIIESQSLLLPEAARKQVRRASQAGNLHFT